MSDLKSTIQQLGEATWDQIERNISNMTLAELEAAEPEIQNALRYHRAAADFIQSIANTVATEIVVRKMNTPKQNSPIM